MLNKSRTDPLTIIHETVSLMGTGPLSESGLREHIFPLFSRALQRQEIYLANHSLGIPLDITAEHVLSGLDVWYQYMDGAWEHWLDELQKFRAGVAQLIGASRTDAVIPRVNAGQGLRAAINCLPVKCPHVVATESEFDSIDFILRAYEDKGLIRVTWVSPGSDDLYVESAVVESIDDSVDFVVLSQVVFQTGQILPNLADIIERAHQHDALVLVDMYHATGVIPGEFDALNADFAVGGSYKYTRGGPGAAWLAVNPRILDDSRYLPVDTGWFGKKDMFAFERTKAASYAEGGDKWLEGTPAVLVAYQARPGIELTLALGVERTRHYNLAQLSYLSEQLSLLGLTPVSRIDHGAFLILHHEHAVEFGNKLRAAGINIDVRPAARGGGYIRFAPDILNTRAQLEQSIEIIATLISVE